MEGIKAVDRIPKNRDKVFFGAWVLFVDDHDNKNIYHIAGPDELDPKLG